MTVPRFATQFFFSNPASNKGIQLYQKYCQCVFQTRNLMGTFKKIYFLSTYHWFMYFNLDYYFYYMHNYLPVENGDNESLCNDHNLSLLGLNEFMKWTLWTHLKNNISIQCQLLFLLFELFTWKSHKNLKINYVKPKSSHSPSPLARPPTPVFPNSRMPSSPSSTSSET